MIFGHVGGIEILLYPIQIGFAFGEHRPDAQLVGEHGIDVIIRLALTQTGSIHFIWNEITR